MTKFRVLCFMLSVLMPAAVPALAAEKKPAAKAPAGRSETLACRLGTEDRHARIAVVVVRGKTDSFAYYSKWKPRTCSVYLQRKGDMFSRWADNGAMTTVTLEKGTFLIEHKPGEYHFIFRDVDRERYCGMDGVINGTLTIKRGSDQCILGGDIMVEGTPLGEANVARAPEGPLADPPPVASTPDAAPAAAPVASTPAAPSSAAPAASKPVAKTPAPPVAATPAVPPAPKTQQRPEVATTPAEPQKPVSAEAAPQQAADKPAAPQSAPAAQPAAGATQTTTAKPAEAASANPFTSFFRSLNRERPAEEQQRQTP